MAIAWKKLLKKIQPFREEVELEQRLATILAQRLQKMAPPGCKVVIAGSVAKGTFLKNETDLDLFILFPLDTPKMDFERRIHQIVKKAFPKAPYEAKYAEHPYIRLFLERKRIDVVPAYQIKGSHERRSAVDRSVLHTRFIQTRLRQRQIPEVLLLKKFLKANELYGAEIRMQGFSGYLCELLIVQYQNFVALLRKAKKWKEREFVDIRKHYRTTTDIAQIIKKFHTPLIVVDPVDKHRNVAAALSEENFNRFIFLAKAFVKKPHDKFFSGPVSFYEKLERMKTKKGGVHTIELMYVPCIEEILWGQLRRLAHQLQRFLEKNGFKVLEYDLYTDEKQARIAIRVARDTLEPRQWVTGPPLSLEKNVKAFKRAHKKARFRIKNRKIYAQLPRRIHTMQTALNHFFLKIELPSRLRKPIQIDG